MARSTKTDRRVELLTRACADAACILSRAVAAVGEAPSVDAPLYILWEGRMAILEAITTAFSSAWAASAAPDDHVRQREGRRRTCQACRRLMSSPGVYQDVRCGGGRGAQAAVVAGLKEALDTLLRDRTQVGAAVQRS